MKAKEILKALGMCLLVASLASAEEKPKVNFRNFTALEVENFENPKYETKEPMPNDWLAIIREDITQRVIATHLFHRVMDFTDNKVQQPQAERVLVLQGKILEFTYGSEAKRRLIGFGAGAGKIVAMCSFVDKASGEVILKRKVDGRVIGPSHPTEGAIRGLAKEVAKAIARNW